MREEIEAAVHFFGRVIVASNSSIDNLAEFKSCLTKLLEERFRGHWHAEVPGKGQGYRSIRIHPSEPLDPVLQRAASISDFSYNNFFIPMEFTLWVDPKDVSCRFGDLKSTYCTVLKNEDNKAGLIDVDELLETAKAVYNRQQHISIQHNSNGSSKQAPQPACVMDIYSYERLVPYPTDMYAFHDSAVCPRPPAYLMYGAGGDGFTTPPPPFPPPSPASPPQSQPQFQPSFLSSAVNTTPRKGKGGNFRKGGTGRTSRQHHHQNGDSNGSSNGGGTTYNHNHNNNHNTNGSTSNGSNSSSSSSNGSAVGPNWNGDRYHWVKGSKQPQHHHHHHHHQPHQPHHHHHHNHHNHQPSQHQQNSGSPAKEAK